MVSSLGEKVTKETRYFLSNLEGSARNFDEAVRAHWGDREPSALDMAFGEDGCGIWQDHAAESLAKLHKIARNLLRQEKKSKRGLKAKSKMASWDNDYPLRRLLQESR